MSKITQLLSLLLLKLGKFDCLEHSLNTNLEWLDFHGLDTLMVKNKVIVQGWAVLSKNHSSFEKSLSTVTGLNEFWSNLSTISAIDNNSLIADVIAEDAINTSIELESVFI